MPEEIQKAGDGLVSVVTTYPETPAALRARKALAMLYVRATQFKKAVPRMADQFGAVADRYASMRHKGVIMLPHEPV